MNAVGPVEPGDGTRPLATPPFPRAPRGPLGSRHERLARLYGRHRRTVLTALTAATVLTAGVLLHATRPRQPPPPAPPLPSQVTLITYLEPQAKDPETDKRNFTFTVELTVESGPPVTVTRISQPYAGLSTTSSPRTPFRTKAGSPHKIAVTLRATECEGLPENAGLPFLDVTLRNTHAMQAHSFILGQRYTQDLSLALQVACGNDSR
ncbi:Tat pathway signal sequence domain protein [Streptomyces sp. NPDC058632]|uniref:Tat pathway signal sequence domain protein n=1 Tax=unclassified Streptomyces TaxID=2593676 RepID=UPI00365D7B95